MPQQQDTATPTIFDTCDPRQDVIAGNIPEDQFAASIDSVAHNTNAPDVYADANKFFEKTYPTNGIQDLLTRLTTRFVHDHKNEYSGTNGIIRLDTSFGGGKTHTEIAAYHLANQPDRINNLHEYLEPTTDTNTDSTGNEALANEYLEQTALGLEVNTSVIVGAEVDATNARCDMTDDNAPATKTLWGEIAYQLFGEDGYEFMREYDERRVAPGAKQLTAMFEQHENPSLIMLDEIAAYMAQASGLVQTTEDDGSLDIAEEAVVGESTLAEQTNAFLMALLSATENTDHVTVVLSIADTAFEDYAEDVRRLLNEITNEFNNIADRTEQSITPTEDTEIAAVLRHRLFEDVDEDERDRVVDAYVNHYESNRSEFPDFEDDDNDDSLEDRLRNAYPFHPTTIDTLTKELDSLPTFHRTRGALKLLSRGMADVWGNGNAPQSGEYDRHFIRLHDLHPSNTEIRSTLLRLYDSTGLDFEATIKADIHSGDGKAHATTADAMYASPAPMGTHLTTTILWKSLVETASGRGVSEPELLFSVSHVDFEVSQYRNVTDKLINATNSAACYYLHREGNGTARYVFKVQPKPIKIVESVDVDEGIVRQTMVESLKDVIGKTSAFNVIMQPEGPHAVPDDPTTHHLCVMDFDTVSLLDTSSADTPPDVLTEMYTYWTAVEGGQQQMRQYKNNIVFLVAEDRRISDARDSAETLASIKHVQDNYNDDYDVSGEAKDKLENMLDAVKGDLTSALRKAYSNMYYADTDGLIHESFTASGTLSDDVTTHLSDSGKLVKSGAGSYGVQWVESRLWNSGTDRMTTKELEQQFGKRPGADLLLSAVPLRETISDIVTDDGYAYWDAETNTGYYTAGAGLQGEQSVTDAENLTSGLATSDVVIGDHTHVFSSVTTLVEADDTDITWQTWECNDCGTEFTDEDAFTKHDCTVVTCDSCGDTFDTDAELDTHTCTVTTVKCDSCGENFPSEAKLDAHTCRVVTREMIGIAEPAHIETAINELRSNIASRRSTFKQDNNLHDEEFAAIAERVVIGINSVDGWKESWFVANNLKGTDLFGEADLEFESIIETQGGDDTLTVDYAGGVEAFASHCKFNMEPAELSSNGGERVTEADFIIDHTTMEDSDTPEFDVVLDELKELLAVNNAFTIQLHADMLFTTETGGDA